MGAEESKPPDAYESAKHVFSGPEHIRLKAMFECICTSDCSNLSKKNMPTQCFDLRKLHAHLRYMPQHISQRLYLYMLDTLPLEPKLPKAVNYYNFLVSLCHILKGTASEKAQFVAFLATGKSAPLRIDEARELMTLLMEAYANIAECRGDFKMWNISKSGRMTAFIKILTQDLDADTFSKEASFEVPALEKWIANSVLPVYVIDSVFSSCFPLVDPSIIERSNLLPQCIGAPWGEFPTLLDLPSLMLLNNTIPAEYRNEWRFLFSSVSQGESFATFTRHVIEKGPCIIFVRDSDGYVFGAFTGVSLTYCGHFIGNETCFLFSLEPDMQIFNSSGINTNYLYLNKGQETLPNGLGMGGQFEYFGFWLDADYGSGHSMAKPRCTTFSSPQLSASPNFTIDKLEVWGVGPDPAKVAVDEDSDNPGSILDTNPEAKAMLAMLNRGPISEGLREPDPTLQIPPED